MYEINVRAKNKFWVVIFDSEQKEYCPIAEFNNKHLAAICCSWLNGGSHPHQVINPVLDGDKLSEFWKQFNNS